MAKSLTEDDVTHQVTSMHCSVVHLYAHILDNVALPRCLPRNRSIDWSPPAVNDLANPRNEYFPLKIISHS